MMNFLTENISSLLVFTIAFLIIYTIVLNLYFISRNGFHLSVNCWFCNQNCKVLYSQRNSFECHYCFQYNGFTKDGDYNKPIEAQRNSSLNTKYMSSSHRSTPKFGDNGLCNDCNRNQELKVLQLANYEPMNEKNYDIEIKHYEQQLEKTYGLCDTCARIVKRTIRKQNAWMFGNRLKSFKHMNVSDIRSKLNVTSVILMLLAFYNLCSMCGFQLTIPQSNLPHMLLPKNVMFLNNFTLSILNVPNDLLKYLLPRHPGMQTSNKTFVSMIGLLIDLLFVVPSKKVNLFTKLSQISAWLISALLSVTHFKSDVALYFETLNVFSSLYLSYIYATTCIEYSGKSKNKYRLKHISSYRSANESDSDDLNVSKESFKTAVSRKQSPATANSIHHINTAKKAKLNQHFSDLNIGGLINDARPNFLPTNSANNTQMNNSFGSYPAPSSNWNTMSLKQDNLPQNFDNQRLNSSYCGCSNGHRSVSPVMTEPVFRQNFHSERMHSAFTPFTVLKAPLSPNCSLERPTRTFLSPSKLNVSSSNVSNNKFWTNFHENQPPQRFSVNSVNVRQYLSPINSNIFGGENMSKRAEHNSRASSTSSGFGSNGDFVKCLSESLPSSRDNSPERNFMNAEQDYYS